MKQSNIALIISALLLIVLYSIGVTAISNPISPQSIADLTNITYAPTYVNRTWTDPPDPDFHYMTILLNDIFRMNVSKGKQYYNESNLMPGRFNTLRVRPVDSSGTINTTWVNQTSWGNIPEDYQLTQFALKSFIASEYPEINNYNITDWEKVSILREWAYEHTPHTRTLVLDDDPRNMYYQQNATGLYSLFAEGKGGVWCGGTGYALHQLYEMYGFTSYVASTGDPIRANYSGHVLTLVQINQSNKSILTVQDAYFDVTLVDRNNNPADILNVSELLRDNRFSDVNIHYGNPRPKDKILLENESQNDVFNSRIKLPNNLVKIKFQMDLQDYENQTRLTYEHQPIDQRSPYTDENYPYLGFFKNIYLIVRNQTVDYSLLAKVKCASDITCDTVPPEVITNLTNTTYAPTYINWTWTDPPDPDFDHVMIYLGNNGPWQVTKGVQYLNTTGGNPESPLTISVKTFDKFGNVNATWMNETRWTAPVIAANPSKDIVSLVNLTYNTPNITFHGLIFQKKYFEH